MIDAALASNTETVVLVEGESDQAAVETVAEKLGCSLAANGVQIVAMSGATNIAGYLRRYGPQGHDLLIAGLCDVGEADYVARALDRAGLIFERPVDPVAALALAGFYACDVDLEDELIRAVGHDRMLAFINDQREGKRFGTYQKQIVQRDQSLDEQLHRFSGVRSGRKLRWARGLADLLSVDEIPAPLRMLVNDVCSGAIAI